MNVNNSIIKERILNGQYSYLYDWKFVIAKSGIEITGILAGSIAESVYITLGPYETTEEIKKIDFNSSDFFFVTDDWLYRCPFKSHHKKANELTDTLQFFKEKLSPDEFSKIDEILKKIYLLDNRTSEELENERIRNSLLACDYTVLEDWRFMENTKQGYNVSGVTSYSRYHEIGSPTIIKNIKGIRHNKNEFYFITKKQLYICPFKDHRENTSDLKNVLPVFKRRMNTSAFKSISEIFAKIDLLAKQKAKEKQDSMLQLANFCNDKFILISLRNDKSKCFDNCLFYNNKPLNKQYSIWSGIKNNIDNSVIVNSEDCKIEYIYDINNHKDFIKVERVERKHNYNVVLYNSGITKIAIKYGKIKSTISPGDAFIIHADSKTIDRE